MRKPLSTIKKEIAKCEVRCANCHAIKTWERKQKNAPTPSINEVDVIAEVHGGDEPLIVGDWSSLFQTHETEPSVAPPTMEADQDVEVDERRCPAIVGGDSIDSAEMGESPFVPVTEAGSGD